MSEGRERSAGGVRTRGRGSIESIETGRLTEERVLEAEKTVLFGGSHLVQLISSGRCCEEMSVELAGLMLIFISRGIGT